MKVDFAHSWNLRRALLKELLEDECISSPVMETGIPGVRFGVKVYPCVLDKANDEYNVFLALMVQSNFNVEADFEFFIESNRFCKQIPYHEFTSTDTERRTIVRSVAEFIDRDSGFFDGSGRMNLEVRGTFKAYGVSKKLSLGDCLMSSDDKDFVVMVEGKTVKVHKSVLRQYSSVFSRMFDSYYKERADNVVKIDDFVFGTVQSAVDYCYGVPVPEDIISLIELLRFSDKYDMKDLNDEVEDRICDLLNPTLVVFIINETALFASDHLVSWCIETLVECVRNQIPVVANEELSDGVRLKVMKSLFDC